MIKLQIAANGTQTITKVCNMCGCHIDDLEVEDIMVKSNTDMRVYDKDGNEITRTELPSNLKECQCEECE
ncbi:hypothetical protein OAA25_00050 [bacterium]|jgi:hypothetical protein|nr:hypothetical protein [bacterium]|tara:strand:- start:421 stop:630 length:210 start_codon:yes stop_codon:yes gene_type:complete